MGNGFLLDTCAVIWISQEEMIEEAATKAIMDAQETGVPIRVSAMTAWEIGLLISRGRVSSTKSAHNWFEDFLRLGGVEVEPASARIMIDSSYLPVPVHSDPADRIIIATAREKDLTIITRDRAILAYGAAGHVKTLAC